MGKGNALTQLFLEFCIFSTSVLYFFLNVSNICIIIHRIEVPAFNANYLPFLFLMSWVLVVYAIRLGISAVKYNVESCLRLSSINLGVHGFSFSTLIIYKLHILKKICELCFVFIVTKAFFRDMWSGWRKSSS